MQPQGESAKSSRTSLFSKRLCRKNSNKHEQQKTLLGPDKQIELFESETLSDVTFLVGYEPDSLWRFPGHKEVLSSTSPVFQAMFFGPMADLPSAMPTDTIMVPDVEPKAFENMLRFQYRGELILTSCQSALETLYAANKYLIPELVALCLAFLEHNLEVKNVLRVYEHVRLYGTAAKEMKTAWNSAATTPRQSPTHTAALSRSTSIKKIQLPSPTKVDSTNCGLKHVGFSPTKCNPALAQEVVVSLQPTATSPEQQQNAKNEESNMYIPLVNKCLDKIDSYAEEVLGTEEFENLEYELIKEIVRRDTLQVNSEGTVWRALVRWSGQECKRRRLAMTPQNKRRCLSNVLFSVRFLLMTREEFQQSVVPVGILNTDEKQWLLTKLQPGSAKDARTIPALPDGPLAYSMCTRRRGVQYLCMDNRDSDPFLIDSWSRQYNQNGGKKKKKKCCKKWTKLFYECIVCCSLIFD